MSALRRSLREHWPEYLIEAAALGTFMLSAGVFGTLLEAPASPVRQALPSLSARLLLGGVAMGLTAIGIIYSPWGRRSGAHMNPAITLTFLRLGKIAPADACWYVVAQFSGGLAGVLSALAVLGRAFAEPPVRFVVTVPGSAGVAVAFAAEAAISFGMMTMVLHTSNHPRFARFTGLCAGVLVAVYIALEAPLSGMSMNPARTVASALPAREGMALWLYFLAPLGGMLVAAELYVRTRGLHRVLCAKLDHGGSARCIFRCGYHVAEAPGAASADREKPAA